MRHGRIGLAGLVLALAAGCGGPASPPVEAETRAGARGGHDVPEPTVTGPITGGMRGHAMWDSWYDLAELGYDEAEYFVSGRARDFAGNEADYTTRIIVRRPREAKRFNGTVLLDWVNVTAQFENAVDTIASHDYLVREGYAFVHVSAQAAGIDGTPLTPKQWDPERYAALSHPGDPYAFDLFAQVARAMRKARGVDPMGGLKVKRVLAAGQSQSAIRLHEYIDAGHAATGVIDGFLVHGDVGAGKVFDTPVPVLQLLSDFEAVPDDPPAQPNYALWEVAGSAHADFWIGYHQEVGQGPRVVGGAAKQPARADAELHRVAGNYGEQPHPLHGVCIAAGTAFPMHYAVNAALDHLNRWVADGTPAPSGPRFAFDAGGALARDAFGNALGGIRYPPVEVPVASYPSTVCGLGGYTVPFTEAQLAALYASHADYYCRTKAAAQQSVRQGFLLAEDAADLLARAAAAKNRFVVAGTPDC